jgi:Rieske Fe-S protein
LRRGWRLPEPAKPDDRGKRRGRAGGRCREAIVAKSELARGSAFPFTNAETGEPGVLVHTQEGEFVAYSAVCTHQQCTVAYRQDMRKLVCPCHGSVFDPADGAKVEAGPAPRPLPKAPIEVRSGRIFLS